MPLFGFTVVDDVRNNGLLSVQGKRAIGSLFLKLYK